MAEDFTSNFIWTKEWSSGDKEKPAVVYFRKKFVSHGIPQKREIAISANCRYKLYINGQFVQEGPQKGCNESAYKDPADIGAYLRDGDNVIAAEVLYYPENPDLRNDSLYYSQYPCLYVEDKNGADDKDGVGADGERLDGRCGWKCHKAAHLQITGEPFSPAPIQGMEIVTGDVSLNGWQCPSYDDSSWEEPYVYSFFEANRPMAPFLLEERTIPAMEHEAAHFSELVCIRETGGADIKKADWESLLAGKTPLAVPANTKMVVELGAGEEMCGYPTIAFAGGKEADVRILYSECYGISQPPAVTPMGERPVPPKKGDRTDYVNGTLEGPVDRYNVAGYGKTEQPESYTPFLFRTFRYIQLAIETKEEPLTIVSYDYLTTGYPLEVKHVPDIPDETMRRIWEISLRTLKRCMHETYVDCPFYEQLQYTMDSRAEILFTYEVSGDDRLARQCMDAFRRTQRSDGILKASAPTVSINVIPGFSIFYILMVHDHMTYFHDRELVQTHFNCIDGVLQYFADHLTEKGLVGSVGGILFMHRYWSFIDWCNEWHETIGVPVAATRGDGSITMESLLYLYGLKKAAELADYIGKHDTAADYRHRAEALSDAIKKYCMGENGLIQDGPGLELYSTHAQIWAILNDLVDTAQGKEMLDKTFAVAGIPQCSVSMSFYLLLALDKVGDREKMDKMWQPWRDMLDNNLTTCVENTTDVRSDCHAWGALMLYAWPKIYAPGD